MENVLIFNDVSKYSKIIFDKDNSFNNVIRFIIIQKSKLSEAENKLLSLISVPIYKLPIYKNLNILGNRIPSSPNIELMPSPQFLASNIYSYYIKY